MKNNSKKSESKIQSQKSSIFTSNNKDNAECLVLKTAGYPFDFELMENALEITDKRLFEQYARDQWLGMEINNESYLFDQKIIPDFAFKVVCVRHGRTDGFNPCALCVVGSDNYCLRRALHRCQNCQ